MKLLLTALVLLSSATMALSAGRVDLGHAAAFTPYDGYMRPVRKVLNNLNGDGTSMEQVRKLMRQGRNFRYSFTDPYTAAYPEQTAASRSGDCKAKSLWLCDQINDGDIRFVVGKTHRNAKLSHAWVLWKNNGRWWILDCTNTSRPIAADTVSSNEYIPFYSWSKAGVYRHASTRMEFAAVAGKKAEGVASRSRRF